MTSTDSASTGSKEIDGLIYTLETVRNETDCTVRDIRAARARLYAAVARLVQQRDEAQKDAEKYRALVKFIASNIDSHTALVLEQSLLQADAALARAIE
jgi:hypothetical protein